jgi:hypothetical protein
MVEAPTPLARASPANSCFQAAKPADELPHWAASAWELKHANMAKAALKANAMRTMENPFLKRALQISIGF